MYEIEITRFQPQPIKQSLSLADAEEASTVLLSVEDETALIFVADIRGRIDYGNFYIWISAGRAIVRLDEHREHYACARDAAAMSNCEAVFIDEDGSTFYAPLDTTVSVSSAKEALAHWLATGTATTAFLWS